MSSLIYIRKGITPYTKFILCLLYTSSFGELELNVHTNTGIRISRKEWQILMFLSLKVAQSTLLFKSFSYCIQNILLLHILCWNYQTLLSILVFPSGSDGSESTCNTGDLGLISGSGSSPGEGNGYPLWYSWLENSMDRGA